MIPPGSRYEESEQHFTDKHLYDRYGYPVLESRNNVPKFILSSQNTTYLVTTLPLPPPPPMEYVVKGEQPGKGWVEHMSLLAFKFLDDSTKWWEIAQVNPQVWYPLDMVLGTSIRIPT